MMRIILAPLLACALSLATMPACAGDDDYYMKDGRVCRSDTGKEVPKHAIHSARTKHGTFLWIAALPEMSDEMQGTERGIYIFQKESEDLVGFLPLKAGMPSQVAFSASGEKLFTICDTDEGRELRYYEFDKAGLSRKLTFQTIGHAVWIDRHRFAFTRNDMAKGPRTDTDKRSGWLSAVMYDSADEFIVPIKEAAETEDFLFYSYDEKKFTLRILRRYVQDKSDWGKSGKVKETMLSESVPAAG